MAHLAAQPPPALSRRFFARPAPVVAQALLGKILWRDGCAGIIVETEAYLGEHDAASHARFGRTRRNDVMYGPAGIAYVYLCYGVHEMFNVVTGKPDDPQAVLVRALEPAGALAADVATCRGPGKLTRALGIDRSHTGVDLTEDRSLRIARGRRIAPGRVATGPRVGVDYAGAWARRPLRFWLADHPAVSKHRPSRR